MGNMSYCRFENTFKDLQDCYEHLEDDLSSDTESRYRKRLVTLCHQIAYETEDIEDE